MPDVLSQILRHKIKNVAFWSVLGIYGKFFQYHDP